MPPDPLQRPTWAEIDLDSLAFNYHSVQRFVGDGVACMAVVKANAYGHGARACATRLEREGVEWFAVATFEEGVDLREGGIERPILVLGGLWPEQIREGLNHGLTPMVFTLEQASAINSTARSMGIRAAIHVKIDTGMGRVGFRYESVRRAARSLCDLTDLRIQGLMTHFASAHDMDSDMTGIQIERFANAVAIFRECGADPIYTDMANSPGAVAFPASRGSLVRLGGVLYGLGGDVLPNGIAAPELRPVMALRSVIAQIKTVPAGQGVGYDSTFMAPVDARVATLPIGYHDGLRRGLSNKGSVIVRGELAPIVGRVSMDWTTIDVTHIPDVEVGDVVTLVGSDGATQVLAEDLARIIDTISYEITCGIGSRVPRIITGNK